MPFICGKYFHMKRVLTRKTCSGMSLAWPIEGRTFCYFWLAFVAIECATGALLARVFSHNFPDHAALRFLLPLMLYLVGCIF